MRNLQVNIFEFEGKPFKDGVSLVFYKPTEIIPEENLYVVGKAISKLETETQLSLVAVQSYSSICCASSNPALLPKTLNVSNKNGQFHWLRDETKNVYPSDLNGRELLRRLMARAISNQQIARGWFVEAYKQVYYWSFNLSEQLSMGVMDVYPGFIFVPYVYEDGSCAVLIDPKFRFVPRKNYREIIDEMKSAGKTNEEIVSIIEGETVVDACPIIDCKLRKTPSSNCRLKGAGRRRLLARLDFTKTPSNASYGNLIEYHQRKDICPNEGLLGRSIKDKPPVALIEILSTGDILEFPLERLRKELKLHELDKFSRLFVMKHIQPSMKERWYLTKGFLTYVDDIKIGRLPPLRLVRRFAEAGSKGKIWEHYETFNEPRLRFAKNKTELEPYIGLESYGPYDLDGKPKRWFNEVYITIFNFSDLPEEAIMNFYNYLVEGFSNRPSFPGLKKLFRVNIPRFTDDVVQKSVRESRIRFRRQPHIAIIITKLTGEKNVRQYKPYKQELSKEGIPCQFVLEKNIGPNVSISKYSGYLKNLSLCIYAKIGGIAWILDQPVGEQKCFIGLSSIIRKDVVYMSLQVFDNYGQWLGGWTEAVRKKNYPEVLESRLNDAVKVFSKIHGLPRQVVLHKDGEIWSDLEMKIIEQSMKPDSKIVSIKKLGIHRIYDLASADYMVKRGSYIQTTPSEAILVTSGPPQEIRGAQKPITIEVKKPKPSTELIRETCKEVFDLSLVYGGYMLAVTSKPVTTHFASKAAALAAKLELKSPNLWKKAWFL
ncbi:MAG: hypothetical protein QXQ94_08950 [Candidatus Bathyarchaeia archaeon]